LWISKPGTSAGVIPFPPIREEGNILGVIYTAFGPDHRPQIHTVPEGEDPETVAEPPWIETRIMVLL
jgi:hypothetical protein